MNKIARVIRPQYCLNLLALVLMYGLSYQIVFAEGTALSIKDVLENKAVQQTTISEVEGSQHIARDEFYRDTPRSSVIGYLSAARQGNFEQAARYLDTRNLPEAIQVMPAKKLARQLSVVLDRTLWIDIDSLSEEEKGHSNDKLPPYRDRIGVIRDKNKRKKNHDILYQSVPGERDGFIWKFSNRTVAKIPELYALYGYNKIEEYFSTHFPAFKILGVELWSWLIFIFVMAVAFLIAKPFCVFLLFAIKKLNPSVLEAVTPFFNGPVRFLLMLYLAHYAVGHFYLTVEAQAIVKAGTLRILIHTWFFIKVITLFRQYWSYRLMNDGKKDAVILLKPIATLLKIFIVISSSLIWLSHVGYNITTLVAGLGIGGLAIALAAQKSLENLLGTITIYASAPVKAGDFCFVGGIRGEIEEVGLWNTRIRTLDRSVVFIPNSQLSSGLIENYSMRDKFSFSRVIYLAHDTSKEKIEKVTEAITDILQNHELVDNHGHQSHLEMIGEFGFEIKVRAFIKTTELAESKRVIAEINLAINHAVQSMGIEYAKVLKPSTPL